MQQQRRRKRWTPGLGLVSEGNADDIDANTPSGRSMLDLFEKTREVLENFNHLLSAHLQQKSVHFRHHTRTLGEMKRDLDSIFHRIGMLEGKPASSHIPEASLLEGEDKDPIPPGTTTIAFLEQGTGPRVASPDSISPPSALALRTCPTSSPTRLSSMAMAT